jgi:hypothetical protein
MDANPLEFLQAIIARMAANSTQMKTWNVGLTTAVIGFVAAKDDHPARAALFTLGPALAFWALDAYYLALERRFRELYTTAIRSGAPSYDLTPAPVTARLLLTCLLRPAVLFLHLPLLVLIAWVARL